MTKASVRPCKNVWFSKKIAKGRRCCSRGLSGNPAWGAQVQSWSQMLRGQQRKLLAACASHVSAMTSFSTTTFHFCCRVSKTKAWHQFCTMYLSLLLKERKELSWKLEKKPSLPHNSVSPSEKGAPSHVFVSKHTHQTVLLIYSGLLSLKGRPNLMSLKQHILKLTTELQ